MKMLQRKLDFLLNKYSVDAEVLLKDRNTVIIDGVELPLLSHRYERRFVELKNIANNGTLVGISVMRVARILEQGSEIYEALYRELDLCEYILQRSIQTIMVMENDNVLNAIAKAENDIVCTIEIAATLETGEIPKDKHEIISQRGIACDVVVDAQLKQDSIYVFGKENQVYTDVDFELYGLSIEDIAVVRTAFAMAQNRNSEEILVADKHVKRLVELAKISAQTGERGVL